MARRGKAKETTDFLSREDWLQAAVRLLIQEGVDQVKVLRLGKVLKASRGSFYWHFRGREELLDEILRYWDETNTGQLIAALGKADDELEDRILRLFALWASREPFYPRFDNAIRAWAAKSAKARRVQRAADQRRLQHIEQLFVDAGYPQEEARIRGDILYFTQVGYYLLDLGESDADRAAKLGPYYFAFTGQRLSSAATERFWVLRGTPLRAAS